MIKPSDKKKKKLGGDFDSDALGESDYFPDIKKLKKDSGADFKWDKVYDNGKKSKKSKKDSSNSKEKKRDKKASKKSSSEKKEKKKSKKTSKKDSKKAPTKVDDYLNFDGIAKAVAKAD